MIKSFSYNRAKLKRKCPGSAWILMKYERFHHPCPLVQKRFFDRLFAHFVHRFHILCLFLYYSNTVRILYNAYTTGFEIFVKNGQIGQVNVEIG